MSDNEILAKIAGAQQLIDFYGRWPSFHDAEVVSIALNRTGISTIAIHTFAGTMQVDDRGHYGTEKHALVRLLFETIVDTEVLGFNGQNVISGLVISAHNDGYKVVLGGCYGAEGYVVAKHLSMKIEPGIPPDSIYSSHA